jgi:hypothetical protein
MNSINTLRNWSFKTLLYEDIVENKHFANLNVQE